jgi:hypothetical protein
MHHMTLFRNDCDALTSMLASDHPPKRPHDDTLEHTADSQERAVGDTAPEVDPPKPPSPSKKKMNEPEFVLISSSGEPSSSKSHVSPRFLAFTPRMFACQ